MFSSSFSRYLLRINIYQDYSSCATVPNLLRCMVSFSTYNHVPSHRFHTSNNIFSTATNKDTLTDEVRTDQEEHRSSKRFPCPDDAKLLRVALIGKPNAGKSTLINALMNLEVCPASTRPHTTRKPQKVIYLEDNTQIVFADTPGVVSQKEIHKFKFKRDFALGPRKAIKKADLVAVMHDVSNRLLRNKLDRKITTLLDNYPEKPVVLILSKVDLITSKRKLLDVLRLLTNGIVGGKPIPVQHDSDRQSSELKMETVLEKAALKKKLKNETQETNVTASCTTRTGTIASNVGQLTVENELLEGNATTEEDDDDPDVRGWSKFDEVFMMSSLTGEGLESFKDYLINQAKLANWMYPEEVLTDAAPQDLAILTLKSKILDNCEKDIPYKVTPLLEIWEENDQGDLTIVIGIQCESPRVLKTLIGHKGSTISSITHATEQSLMKLLRRNVSLHIKATCDQILNK